MIYEAINYPILLNVPKTAKRILDIGCGSGEMGKHIKKIQTCEIVGITYSQAEADIAARRLDKVFIQDLNIYDSNTVDVFDCIICSHVLEHLYLPENLLVKLCKNLNVDGVIIIALPNILHWKQRIEFMKGNFKYTEGGLMDKTHVRFFDWKSSRRLVEQSGLKIISHSALNQSPLNQRRNKLKNSPA